MLHVLVLTSLIASARAEPAALPGLGSAAIAATEATPPEPDPDAELSVLVAYPEPPRRLRRSHPIAIAQVLGINAVFSLGALALGKDYVKISPGSIWTNLQSDWVWDEDAFATNQFGHPYLGSLMYSAARSNGIGMFGASIYTFVGSAFWELVMETETPSLNDQFFTPFGGVLFGEVLHRFGRTLLWDNDPRPRIGRLLLSTVIDPVGAFTRSAFGEAWSMPQPPVTFGYLSLGWNGLSADFDAPGGRVFEQSLGRLHASVVLSYGLPTSSLFRPRRPMDHFEFHADASVSPDDAFASIHTRGLLWGRAFTLGGAHAVGGLFGGYDFANPKQIRIGAASLGLGATAHLPLGDRNFVQGTLIASLIPFGAAGGGVDEDQAGTTTERDYHRGYGSAQLLIARLARRGLGVVYVTNRTFEIDGTYFDEGSEVVSFTRFGVMAAVIGRHGLQVESTVSVRRGNFPDDARDILDTSAQLRISYVLLQDRSFGGGAAR